MPKYAELVAKAKELPEKLVVKDYEQNTYGSFFCACAPPIMVSDPYRHARLIQSIATCLPYYADVNNETRHSVLLGIYIYVWKLYDSHWNWLLKDEPLLVLIKSNLNLTYLHELDNKDIALCYQELKTFSLWVFEHRFEHKELNALYDAFPPDMFAEMQTILESASEEKGSVISSLMGYLGMRQTF